MHMRLCPRLFQPVRSQKHAAHNIGVPHRPQVPLYSQLLQERFERCLDLYLCPRTVKKRMNVDPESLLPKLPKPSELKPYPSVLTVLYEGHTAAVNSISVHHALNPEP